MENKEKKIYWAIYTCQNCGTEKWVSLAWGTSMPSLVKDAKEEYGQEEAPNCDYCGCTSWSHGKKPKGI